MDDMTALGIGGGAVGSMLAYQAVKNIEPGPGGFWSPGANKAAWQRAQVGNRIKGSAVGRMGGRMFGVGKRAAILTGVAGAAYGAYMVTPGSGLPASHQGVIAGAGLGAAAVGYGLYKSPGARAALGALGAEVGTTLASPFIVAGMANNATGRAIGSLFTNWETRHDKKIGYAAQSKKYRPTRMAWRTGTWPVRALAGLAGRHPVAATLAVGTAAVATMVGAGAVGHTQQKIEQSQMTARYQNAQFESLQSMSPISKNERPAPSFIDATRQGRRKRIAGGHMGATGDLVFAMHNRR